MLLIIYMFSCSGLITSVREERELFLLLSFTCNYVVLLRLYQHWHEWVGYGKQTFVIFSNKRLNDDN